MVCMVTCRPPHHPVATRVKIQSELTYKQNKRETQGESACGNTISVD